MFDNLELDGLIILATVIGGVILMLLLPSICDRHDTYHDNDD